MMVRFSFRFKNVKKLQFCSKFFVLFFWRDVNYFWACANCCAQKPAQFIDLISSASRMDTGTLLNEFSFFVDLLKNFLKFLAKTGDLFHTTLAHALSSHETQRCNFTLFLHYATNRICCHNKYCLGSVTIEYAINVSKTLRATRPWKK